MATASGEALALTDYEVSVAPVGSTLPTDLDTALDAAFDPFGLVSEDGIVRGRSADVTELRDAAGGLVRTFRANDARTWTITALNNNAVVRALEEPGADEVDAAGVITRTVKDAAPAKRAVVFELTDGDYVRRVVVPEAEITPTDVGAAGQDSVETVTFEVKTIKQADGTHYIELLPGESV